MNKVRISLLREEPNLVLLNGAKLLPAPPKVFTLFSEHLNNDFFFKFQHPLIISFHPHTGLAPISFSVTLISPGVA